MNDRQRVEAAIIPSLLYVVFQWANVDGAEDLDRTTYDAVMNGAKAAAHEPLIALSGKDFAKLSRRINRAVNKLDAMLREQTVAKGCMATYYLLNDLLNEERLFLHEGSQFAQAMETVLVALNDWFSHEKLDVSAQRKARKLREALATEGYFQ